MVLSHAPSAFATDKIVIIEQSQQVTCQKNLNICYFKHEQTTIAVVFLLRLKQSQSISCHIEDPKEKMNAAFDNQKHCKEEHHMQSQNLVTSA